DEGDRRQRQVAVDGIDGEPRPACRSSTDGEDDPEHDGAGEQEERDDPGGAGEVPVRLHAGDQPPLYVTEPSSATKRAGRPCSSSHRGASSDSTIEAVAATFASTHVAPATLTVRQQPSAGRPVAGSSRWWASPASVVQRR